MLTHWRWHTMKNGAKALSFYKEKNSNYLLIQVYCHDTSLSFVKGKTPSYA